MRIGKKRLFLAVTLGIIIVVADLGVYFADSHHEPRLRLALVSVNDASIATGGNLTWGAPLFYPFKHIEGYNSSESAYYESQFNPGILYLYSLALNNSSEANSQYWDFVSKGVNSTAQITNLTYDGFVFSSYMLNNSNKTSSPTQILWSMWGVDQNYLFYGNGLSFRINSTDIALLAKYQIDAMEGTADNITSTAVHNADMVRPSSIYNVTNYTLSYSVNYPTWLNLEYIGVIGTKAYNDISGLLSNRSVDYFSYPTEMAPQYGLVVSVLNFNNNSSAHSFYHKHSPGGKQFSYNGGYYNYGNSPFRSAKNYFGPYWLVSGILGNQTFAFVGVSMNINGTLISSLAKAQISAMA